MAKHNRHSHKRSGNSKQTRGARASRKHKDLGKRNKALRAAAEQFRKRPELYNFLTQRIYKAFLYRVREARSKFGDLDDKREKLGSLPHGAVPPDMYTVPNKGSISRDLLLQVG